MVGLQYDSNVNNGHGSDPYGIDDDPYKEEAGLSHQEMGALTHFYDFGKLGGYLWQTNLVGFLQSYMDSDLAETYNVRFVSLGTGLSRNGKTLRVVSQVHADQVHVGGEHYMDVTGVKVDVYKPHTQRVTGEYGAKYQSKDNIEDDGKDSSYYEMKAGAKYLLESKDIVGGSLTYSSENASVAAGNSKNTIGLKGSYSRSYTKQITGSYDLGYKLITYPEYGNGDSRKDAQMLLKAGGSYQYSKSVQLTGSFSYSDNGSDQEVYAYKKYLIGLNGMVIF